jgi:hypothetical protein
MAGSCERGKDTQVILLLGGGGGVPIYWIAKRLFDLHKAASRKQLLERYEKAEYKATICYDING